MLSRKSTWWRDLRAEITALCLDPDPDIQYNTLQLVTHQKDSFYIHILMEGLLHDAVQSLYILRIDVMRSKR